MEKPPAASGHNITSSDNIQTWNLKVYVHCEGCKRKIFKILQSIDGVYKTVIDSKQHKATVTGSVNGDTLVQKLLKSGKHAEILTADNASGNPKKTVTTADDVDDEKEESENAMTGQKIAEPAAGGGTDGKKKKKKGDKNNNNEGLVANTTAVEHYPGHEVVIAATYQNYYPTPAYGMSYSASYPSVESSCYTPPVYGYAQSHPSLGPPPPPPPTCYSRSAFDDHDDEGADGRRCTFM